jgi:hypothetical protein
MDIAEATNFDVSKPVQPKTLIENLEANFGDLAKPKMDFAYKKNFDQSKPLRTKTLTEK